jgi:hypothetical protein
MRITLSDIRVKCKSLSEIYKMIFIWKRKKMGRDEKNRSSTNLITGVDAIYTIVIRRIIIEQPSNMCGSVNDDPHTTRLYNKTKYGHILIIQ